MSLISKLKAVVAGDEYLDDDFDELDYESEDELDNMHDFKQNQKNPNVLDACTAEGRLTSLQVSARRLTLAHHVWCIIQIPSRLA